MYRERKMKKGVYPLIPTNPKRSASSCSVNVWLQRHCCCCVVRSELLCDCVTVWAVEVESVCDFVLGLWFLCEFLASGCFCNFRSLVSVVQSLLLFLMCAGTGFYSAGLRLGFVESLQKIWLWIGMRRKNNVIIFCWKNGRVNWIWKNNFCIRLFGYGQDKNWIIKNED